MARVVRPTLAIRCVQSSCRTLFEVAMIKDDHMQEVVCPGCGEHYVYYSKQEKYDELDKEMQY